MMVRNKVTYILLALILIGIACKGKEPIIKRPPHGKATEFHRKPAKIIVHPFADYNYRGINRSADRKFYNGIGAGLGFYFHFPMRWQWVGHKRLYYYADVTVSPEYSGNPYPGEKSYIASTYPGIYIRSYLPFFFKVFYGGGVVVRLGSTPYDQWGIYGRAGLELCGLTSSFLVIGHPGQSNWEGEARLGFMAYKPVLKCVGK
ncbi:MAG: hypothetical protein D6767_07950 [Candidatus Hydrogenedentota bacterium]|nr:MAG: hypothetical protein D6767_07950 [Candidatus Hydrogenedentota bacterium]